MYTSIPRWASQNPRINAWYEFIQAKVARFLDESSILNEQAESAKIEIPKLNEEPLPGVSFKIIHIFDEITMETYGDKLIEYALSKIRENSSQIKFQGEEVVSCWYAENGIKLPNYIREFGEFTQGGYLMYMGPNSRQNVHQHGIRLSKNEYYPNSGSRFLIGLIGAEKTSIRHVEGIFNPPRGALITIHFKQFDKKPGAAHQFWNTGGETGNIFMSMHIKDSIDNYTQVKNPGNFMNLRTYEFDDAILISRYNTYFKTNLC